MNTITNEDRTRAYNHALSYAIPYSRSIWGVVDALCYGLELNDTMRETMQEWYSNRAIVAFDPTMREYVENMKISA